MDRECVVCGEDMTERRADARFCSAACRATYHWAKNNPIEVARLLHRFREDTARRCAGCGASLSGTRYGSRWCGTSCRKRAARERSQKRSEAAQALSNEP